MTNIRLFRYATSRGAPPPRSSREQTRPRNIVINRKIRDLLKSNFVRWGEKRKKLAFYRPWIIICQ